MLPALGDDALEMCQTLLRLDTTNPPGRERIAADYLDAKLAETGYQSRILESAPERANLVCRYEGDGSQRPLLLTAHLDVVEAYADKWKYPPFSGEIAEGCLWGRGAIDMKNMAAMSAAVMRKLATDRPALERDVIFAAVADEEAGCDFGSRWLVENHRELVEAEYAIGESGGFSLHLGNRTFYPIQVAEKGICWVRARVTGEPGHGSMPRDDNPVVNLGAAIGRLTPGAFPTHPTRWVKDFLTEVANAQPALARPLVRALARPALLGRLLKLLPSGTTTRGLSAILSNTASPTVLSGGAKINVIPGEASVLIDGRTLPGQTDEDFLRELAAILGPDVELEIIKSAPPVVTEPIESPLYDVMREAINEREPDATVVPYLIPGFTDAKYFTQTGARWYGFSPVRIEKGSGVRFAEMFHGHDERVPVDGLKWGAELLYDVVTRFCRYPGQRSDQPASSGRSSGPSGTS
jgi:acetylornithine deacetylase/succinyl-diaminopimelate desuccinylase-like protein